jgi:hypothetical protein
VPDDFSVRIPADVEREDRILAGLTARQVAILASAAVVMWLAFTATRHLLPLPIFAVIAFPFGAITAVIALGRRDGLPLDRLILAALRQARSPRKLVLAPEQVTSPPTWMDPGQPVALPAPLRLPAGALTDEGVIDLGADGAAVVCAASTVSFALRTPGEQAALVAVFGRWLNSLSAPVQIVIRAEPVDITPLISGLRDHAPALPHPELEQAAIEHAEFLTDLAQRRDLLHRQVLIVLREPRHGGTTSLGQRHGQRPARDGGAGQRVLRRAGEAAAALAAAGITVNVLTGGEATAVLAACCNPWRTTPAAAGRAAPSQVITSPGGRG